MDKIEKKKYKCPCCGYLTLDSVDEYDICPVCYWEDDLIQKKDPEYEGGANKVSLRQARENYLSLGVCEEKYLQYVRKPLREEMDISNEDAKTE